MAHNPRMENLSVDERRLKFLLRRGMKELDVMVTRYHAGRYAQAPEAERQTFVHLLTTVEDPDIWSWTMGYSPTPEQYREVVAELRVFR